MKIKFCGAARTVTGSCYLVDTGEVRFLVDCGAFQGYDVEEKNNEPFPFDPGSIDYVFLTHAHYDHCGRLPKLVKHGFNGRIISTQPTRDLTKIILLDSAKLQQEEYERFQVKAKGASNITDEVLLANQPMYSEVDVDATMELFEIYPYGNSVRLKEGMEFRMRDAGHILGSAMMEFWVKTEAGRKRKFVFSGDLGQPGARNIQDP